MVLDVRDYAATEKALAELPEAFRDYNVVCPNAGLALGLEPAQEAVLSDWQTMIDTNITGMTYTVRAALPAIGQARPGACGVHRLGGGRLSLSGRQRLWRHQGLREAVRPELLGGSGRHRRARDQYRARPSPRPNSPWSASAATMPRPTRSTRAPPP